MINIQQLGKDLRDTCLATVYEIQDADISVRMKRKLLQKLIDSLEDLIKTIRLHREGMGQINKLMGR